MTEHQNGFRNNCCTTSAVMESVRHTAVNNVGVFIDLCKEINCLAFSG